MRILLLDWAILRGKSQSVRIHDSTEYLLRTYTFVRIDELARPHPATADENHGTGLREELGIAQGKKEKTNMILRDKRPQPEHA